MKHKLPARVVINERRAYFECRFGQLHVRTAFPSTGGFDELTPLICLHDLADSSAAFDSLLPQMATDRSVYAIDLPGHGESDHPPLGIDLPAYAEAVGDFISNLRLRELDLLGIGFGAAVAAELACLKDAAVRSAVLINAPGGSAEEWPEWTPNDRGEGLEEAFAAARAGAYGGGNLRRFAARFGEMLRQGPRAHIAGNALAAWSGVDRWRLVRQRALVLDVGRKRPVVAESMPMARVLDGAQFGADVLENGASSLASRLKAFLDTNL